MNGHFPLFSQTKISQQGMLDTAEEVRTNSLTMFSDGSFHVNTSVLADRKNYFHLLFADSWCFLGDLPREIHKRDGWWERIKACLDDTHTYTHIHTHTYTHTHTYLYIYYFNYNTNGQLRFYSWHILSANVLGKFASSVYFTIK